MANNNQELVKATKSALLEKCEPTALNKSLASVATVSGAMKIAEQYPSKFPSLAKIKTHYGSQAVEGIIKLYLIEMAELVNLKRPLTEKQIDVIASNVTAEYYNLTIADVHVLFKKVIKGEYGEFYESLDVPKVMKWFASYFDERCNSAQEDSIASQFGDKGGNITSERAKKHFETLEKKMTKR